MTSGRSAQRGFGWHALKDVMQPAYLDIISSVQPPHLWSVCMLEKELFHVSYLVSHNERALRRLYGVGRAFDDAFGPFYGSGDDFVFRNNFVHAVDICVRTQLLN